MRNANVYVEGSVCATYMCGGGDSRTCTHVYGEECTRRTHVYVEKSMSHTHEYGEEVVSRTHVYEEQCMCHTQVNGV